MLAAARRIAALLAAVGGATALLSLVAGLALGVGLDRAISMGFYLAGTFLVVAGFFAGNRGPLRRKTEPSERELLAMPFGLGLTARGARRATSEERQDTLATAGLFLCLGVALIVVGVLADGRVALL